MNDGKRICLLRDMEKHIPKAPLTKCLEWVDETVRFDRGEYYAKCALSLLSEILLVDNGKIREDLSSKYKEDKAMLWALWYVQNSHAWTVCGPVENAMEKLKEECGKLYKKR